MKFILTLFISMSMAFIACDNTTTNTATIQIYLQGKTFNTKHIATRSLQESIRSIRVSVYDGDPAKGGTLLISKTYGSTVQVATIETQSGKNRTVVVEALNAVDDLLFKGQSTLLELEPGKTQTVEITMSDVSPSSVKSYDIVISNIADFDFSQVAGGVLYVSTFQADASVFDGEINDIYLTCDSIKQTQVGTITPTSSSVDVSTSENTYNFLVIYGFDGNGDISYAGAAIISGGNPPSTVEIHSCMGNWDEDDTTPETLHDNCKCTH